MTVRLNNGCCDNLNQSSANGTTDRISDDTNTTIAVSQTSTTILTANTARRLVKLFVISLSEPGSEVWIKYGGSATLTNSAHPLPLKHLLIIDTQAQNVISAICSSGTAQIRVSAANAL